MRKINVLILSLLVMASCGDKEKAYKYYQMIFQNNGIY